MGKKIRWMIMAAALLVFLGSGGAVLMVYGRYGASRQEYAGAAGAGDQSGAIFVDALCAPGFADSNTVIYGHSMNDGSMFGGLEAWKDQAYYEAHPVMWLLTRDACCRVRLFSGYTTSAASGTYTVFRGPGEDFSEYLSGCRARSDFSSGVSLPDDGRYVVLSTCAYDFDGARYVLHGLLEPLQ